ncbi:MAG: hypothetical protein P1U56_06915 [Saprospiraceae bacterium]|nr:hypothetical protein [Saprospiraceae bacterium]
MKSKIYRIPESDISSKIEGLGQKGLLIVIREEDKIENQNTLEGLVKAIKYDMNNDVIIVSQKEGFTDVNSLLSENTIHTVILMGIEPDSIGFSIQASPYFLYKMENFSVLLTDSLRAMNEDKAKKMKFWQILQERFLS